MMKKLIILLTAIFILNANNVQTIKNLIGSKKYYTYRGLLKPIINEKSLTKTLEYLQNNGLLDIFFDKPKIIHPTFVFKNNNPVFNTKTLYSVLKSLGYYFFYPVEIKNSQNRYTLTLELKSTHYIDPLLFTKALEDRGCKVVSIYKNKNYTYVIDASDETLSALKVIEDETKQLNAKGIYWLNPNGFSKILVATSPRDSWYPYIVFFDKNLNILNIISKENTQNKIILNIPPECAYIKVTDTFSKENFKRGIIIKGIK